MAKRDVTVYTSGSWDLFHVGHLNIIRRSRELGDRLIVGVSSDALVEEYKGAKPVIPYEQRAAIVGAVKGVDEVVEQTVLSDVRILKRHQVDVLTIGDDWRDKYLEGVEWMKQHGKVVYVPYTPDVSTTEIKRNIIGDAYRLIHAELTRERESGERWAREHAAGKDVRTK